MENRIIAQSKLRHGHYLFRRGMAAAAGAWVMLFLVGMAPGWAAAGETDSAETDSAEHSVSASETGSPKTPPPAPTEFIAAWIADLQQSSERWIQVDLSDQKLIAWEGDVPIYSAIVSTGRVGDWTPPGVYAVETKYRVTSMQGEGYNIPDVPYVMYFFGSYAIHGVYWHDNFGAPASRGCVGLEPEQAAWLFGWASEGTRVIVQE
ncbi:MAG: L,D-transpeptidase [Pegethrix bostrychoides GSE-TBD4-15B]|jgi:lipoprotein-anchoring transpeptidase ErfK/SrfK|uniref:L,D-transpeptidase n=1 Tax=Pegethrix bostrychoides GSE-TBD4-15B TaxID=2839662 RepID=A0A951PDB7_9CYAN|nr:L,D-transpeptidase [Pegethrix bostrychoides GSE-TBD4-15B]